MQHDIDKIIAEIEARSYCIIPSVISPEKADEARTILEGLLEAEATDASRAAKTQRVGGIAVKQPNLRGVDDASLDRCDLEEVSGRRCDLLDLDRQHQFPGFRYLQMASRFSLPVAELPLAEYPGQRANDLAAQRLFRGERRHRHHALQPQKGASTAGGDGG